MGDEKLNLSIDADVKRLAQEKAKRTKRTVTQYITDLVLMDSGENLYSRFREDPFMSAPRQDFPARESQNTVTPHVGGEKPASKSRSTSYPRGTKRKSA